MLGRNGEVTADRCRAWRPARRRLLRRIARNVRTVDRRRAGATRQSTQPGPDRARRKSSRSRARSCSRRCARRSTGGLILSSRATCGWCDRSWARRRAWSARPMPYSTRSSYRPWRRAGSCMARRARSTRFWRGSTRCGPVAARRPGSCALRPQLALFAVESRRLARQMISGPIRPIVSRDLAVSSKLRQRDEIWRRNGAKGRDRV